METLKEMKKKYRISISEGNMKMGMIPSISLPPLVSCNTDLTCYEKGCYAKRMVNFRVQVGIAWNKNYSLYITNHYAYKELLKDKIRTLQSYGIPKYFRWHVGGDILDETYLKMMYDIAKEMDDTKFMVFTKNYKLHNIFKYSPENLSIIISLWPEEKKHIEDYILYNWNSIRDIRNSKIAWLDNDPRIESEAFNPFYCHGSCITCRKCWSNQRDIVLRRH